MFSFRIVFSACILPSLILSAYIDDTTSILNSNNEILESNYSHDQLDYSHGNKNVALMPDQKPITWLQTARDALGGPAGEFVVHFAKEMISRSAGNSQILSLNLTNLLILVLLKALIFAAGLIGAGNWSQYGRARQMEQSPFIQSGETPLFIGYLAMEGSGQNGCLSRAACRSPEIAGDYVKAAKALIQGIEIFDHQMINSTVYALTLNQMEQSIVDGINGAACNAIYPCRL